MTLTTRFFADGTLYGQDDFAKLMKDALGDGYAVEVGNGLVPSWVSGMTVSVGLGRGYIQGYSFDVEDTPYELTVGTAHATYDRIDRIVAKLSAITDKTITLEIKAGTPASNPVAPSLTRGTDYYEISLAQVYVTANVASLSASAITDERNDTAVCGPAYASTSWGHLYAKPAYIETFPDFIPVYANVSKSGKDASDIYTVFTWELPSAKVVSGYPAKWVSTLSGGTTPNYTTRTVTVYGSDKITVLRSYVFTRTYDPDDVLISEVLQ